VHQLFDEPSKPAHVIDRISSVMHDESQWVVQMIPSLRVTAASEFRSSFQVLDEQNDYAEGDEIIPMMDLVKTGKDRTSRSPF